MRLASLEAFPLHPDTGGCAPDPAAAMGIWMIQLGEQQCPCGLRSLRTDSTAKRTDTSQLHSTSKKRMILKEYKSCSYFDLQDFELFLQPFSLFYLLTVFLLQLFQSIIFEI